MRRTLAVLCLFLILPPAASAQTAQDRIAARVLFDEGRRLMKTHDVAEACRKFAQSLAIEPLLGTKLNLAECHRLLGKTATAWAEFREAENWAARTSDDRETFAHERFLELDKSLAYLTIRLSEGAKVPGLEIKQDGQGVRPALLGVAVPVDPGVHLVEASAPGKTAWSSRVEVGPAAGVTVEVPVLGEPTRYAAPPPAAGPQPVPATSPVQPPSPSDDPGRGRRYLGLGIGGVGVAAVGAGLVFGLLAKSSWDDAKDGHCDENGACDPTGFEELNSAHTRATISTVLVGAGAAAIAGGVIVTLTAPRAHPGERITAAPLVGPGVVGAVLRGGF